MAKRRRKTAYMTRQAARRSKRRSMNRSVVLLVIMTALFFVAHYALNRQKSNANLQQIENLTYVKTAPGLNEQIIQYKGMTVSFNPKLHIPNWVSWELTADEVDGTVARDDRFYANPDIAGCATPADYTGSGYDRGHMAPAGDMKWDEMAMKETFCMTNILPQESSLNRGTWKKLEEKCRARAAVDSAIVIVCGPVLVDKPREYIGSSQVAVPERLFKVILSPWAKTPQAIGFLMDNGTVAGGMQAAAVTVDEIEALTGHDFFSTLPDSIENQLESTINFTRWSRLK